jgi:hypothetical protein
VCGATLEQPLMFLTLTLYARSTMMSGVQFRREAYTNLLQRGHKESMVKTHSSGWHGQSGQQE